MLSTRIRTVALLVVASCATPSGETESTAPSESEPSSIESEDSDSQVTESEASDTESTTESEESEPPEEIPGISDTFSEPHGYVTEAFELALSAPVTDGELYYTLDGTAPSADNGTLYSGPLTIESTTVMRVALVSDGTTVDLGAGTWIFADQIPDQEQPDGWPDEWWSWEEDGPYPADYWMDEEIIEDEETAEYFPDLFYDIPTVSIVMDPDDLFGDEGIHENSEESGSDWERDAWIEWLDHEGGEGFTHYTGIRTHGGSGRKPERSCKKSFRLVFASEYDGDLEYGVFPESEVTNFDTLVLRAGYNRSWAHYQHNQRNRAQYIRETLGTRTHREMGYMAVQIRYVHLFIDGVYWGMYQIQERPDADWMADHLGGDKDDYDAVNSGELVDGTEDAWDALWELAREDLSDDSAYEALGEMLDMEAFADYLILNFFYGNVDWPDRNWWAVRERVDGEVWQFVSWDTELIQSGTDTDMTDVDDEGTPGELWQALQANEEFMVLFGDSVQKLLFGEGVLTIEVNKERYDTIAQEVVPAVIGENARWGDHWRDLREAEDAELYTYGEHWLDEYDRVMEDWYPERPDEFLAMLVTAGYFPSLSAAELSDYGGEVEAGTEVEITADEGTAMCTTDGTDPREPGGDTASAASECDATVTIDEDTTLMVRVLDGSTWSALVEAEFTVTK